MRWDRIGNCDAHGKNFSLLYKGRQVALAPFYDLVSTTVYPELTDRFSMRFGGEYRFESIQTAELEHFAAEVGVRPKFVKDTLRELIDAAGAARDRVSPLAELSDSQPLIHRILEAWDSRSRNLAKYI